MSDRTTGRETRHVAPRARGATVHALPTAFMHGWSGALYDRLSDAQARSGRSVARRLPEVQSLVVDAGCGSGRVTEYLLERFPSIRVLGLDASASMIDTARARLDRFGDRVELRVHDLRDPLALETPADAVFSTGTFHWLHHHGALFRRLRRMCRHGASLVAQCGGAGSFRGVMDAIAELEPGLETLNHYATVERTRTALESAGFAPEAVWTHSERIEFDSGAELREFLSSTALAPHLERLPVERRKGFVEAVADRLPGRYIDTVRLEIDAVAL